MFSPLIVGIILQVIFFILFFGAILPEMNNLFGFFTCFIIGATSLILGINSIKNNKRLVLSIIITFIAVIILLFTFFAYFSVEGDGFGPAIFR